MTIDDRMMLFCCKNNQNGLNENKITSKRFILFVAVLKCNDWWSFCLQYDSLRLIFLTNDKFELCQTDIFYSRCYFVFLQQIELIYQSS